ncbi:MAG: amidase [Actinomycetota bacterium]
MVRMRPPDTHPRADPIPEDPMDDLAYLSTIELAERISAGVVSSREATEAALDRIGRLDGDTNIVVTLDGDRAVAAADAADAARAAGFDLGPLHGVPVTIKDSFQTAGLRTTSGAPELSDHVPERDADPVARLRDAGVVVLGKTNLPIYAGDWQSYNEVFGTSSNPWDTTRTVGGSSGGSAAALAAGFTPLELGSDIAGSIRQPAHACGVVGHKPSYGIVSARGQIPGPPGTLTQADLAVAGPLARTVDDCELALELLAGADAWHDLAWSLELPPPRVTSADGLRVAVWIDEPSCPLSAEVRDLLLGVASALSDAGAIVDDTARPAIDFAKAVRTFEQLLGSALSGAWTPDEIERMAAEPRTGGLGDTHAALRHRSWLSANERRLQMRARWAEFFETWDVVLLPVAPVPAIPHDHGPVAERAIDVDGTSRPYTDQGPWMGLTGLAYLPATVVPAGLTSSGLPVGVQLAGPFLEDRTTLQAARIVEELLGGFSPPPGYAS